MERRISATEARRHLGALMKSVVENDEAVIVERDGVPQVVVLSLKAYEEMRGRELAWIGEKSRSPNSTSNFEPSLAIVSYPTPWRSSIGCGRSAMNNSLVGSDLIANLSRSGRLGAVDFASPTAILDTRKEAHAVADHNLRHLRNLWMLLSEYRKASIETSRWDSVCPASLSG